MSAHTPSSFVVAQKTSDRVRIGKKAAVALYGANWWVGKSAREIAGFQLSTQELCLPFGLFHEAVESALGRPVWTHEFGLNYQGLLHEFHGKEAAPALDQIMGLIPPEKLIVVSVEPEEEAK